MTGAREGRFSRLLPALLVAVAACGTSDGQSTPPPTPSAPVTTAILVASTNDPLRVRGSDEQEHLEYNLLISNFFNAAVTLLSIDVFDPEGETLLHLEGADLVAQMQQLSGTEVNSAEIVASASVAIVMNVVLPAGGVPKRLGHRIDYTIPDGGSAPIIGSRTIDGPVLAVDRRAPIVLAPPLRGAGWLDANGCCIAATPHRSARLVTDGLQVRNIETFAIDWSQLRDGRFYEGDGSRNEQWFGYGQDVVAAAAGTVTDIRDDLPNQTPNQPPVGS